MEGMTRWSDMEKIFVQEKTKEGTGGMESKVEVAMSFALHGRIAYIARGLQDRVLLEIISGRSIGTRVQLKA
jgi:glutamate 5-kinase